MKTLRLAGVILLAFLTIGFASCNKDNNGNNTNDEIIEYQGDYPAPENIEYVEDGISYEIEAIPGQVVISTDEDYKTVVNAVNAHEGKIIEQYPQYGLYTVEVVVGNENAFVAAMNDLNISSELNLVEYPKERYDYFVFDDYVDANGVQHGRKVSNILSECQNDAVINEVNNVVKLTIPVTIPSPIPIPIVYLYATTLNYTNFLLWDKLLSQDMVLVNWSHGYGGQSADWQNMSPEEKSSYKTGWKKAVARKLDQIIRLKKKNPNIDIVFAHAAGNERCPEISQMINDLKSNPKYKTVLEENMIFVSDYSIYANTSSVHGDFCYIKEHPYYSPNGGTTSFATPQALCYINQVIKGTVGEDGKNITAVQALAAVKAAIRQNSNGELDLDEALEMARIMYSTMSHEIIVTPNELTFEAVSSGYQVINVVVNSVNPLQWTATCNETWVHLSVTSGTNDTNVLVSVDNNTSTAARNAMITFTTEIGTAGIVFVSQAKGAETNGDWVDLGFPSGLLWATRNVGANNPEDYGDYFAWGETQPKSVYIGSTYKYMFVDSDGHWIITKYNTDSHNGNVDNLTTLQPGDDAASANWGNGARMPTKDEWQSLLFLCSSVWTTQNGVKGRLFTGWNGNTLFLPAGGYYDYNGLNYVGSEGCYWSSSLNEEEGYTKYAGHLYFTSGRCYAGKVELRTEGRLVRPVRSAFKN